MPNDFRLLVNVAHIQEKGFILCGKLPASVLNDIDNDRLRCANPLHYRLHLKLVTKALLITGDVSIELNSRCDRCLSYYIHRLQNKDICHYMDIPFDKQLDLTENIREDILIVLPQKFVCTPNCAGLCFRCGQNLNIQSCNCSRCEDTVNIWNKLDKLRI